MIDEVVALDSRLEHFGVLDVGQLLADSEHALAEVMRLIAAEPGIESGFLRMVVIGASQYGLTRRRLAEHVLWFLSHDPSCSVLGSGLASLYSGVDDEFDEAVDHWRRLFASFEPPAAIVYNAVFWFGHAVPNWLIEFLESNRSTYLPEPLRSFLLAMSIRFDDVSRATELLEEALSITASSRDKSVMVGELEGLRDQASS